MNNIQSSESPRFALCSRDNWSRDRLSRPWWILNWHHYSVPPKLVDWHCVWRSPTSADWTFCVCSEQHLFSTSLTVLIQSTSNRTTAICVFRCDASCPGRAMNWISGGLKIEKRSRPSSVARKQPKRTNLLGSGTYRKWFPEASSHVIGRVLIGWFLRIKVFVLFSLPTMQSRSNWWESVNRALCRVGCVTSFECEISAEI